MERKRKNPLEWGWEKTIFFSPVRTTLEAAPESVLQMISCGCTTDYSTLRSKWFKSGLQCSILCRNCQGTSCENSESLELLEGDMGDDPDFEDMDYNEDYLFCTYITLKYIL